MKNSQFRSVVFSKDISKMSSMIIYMIAWGTMLLGYWRGINNHIPILKNFTDELEWMIILIPLFFSLPSFAGKLRAFDYLFVLGCLLFYLLNFVLYPQNDEFLYNRLFNFAVITIPFYFVGATIDIRDFYGVFFSISCTAILICAFYNLFYVGSASYSGDADVSEYNMDLAYNLLPHVLFVSWVSLREMDVWKLLIMLLGLFLLLSLGTRGPVACAILFVAIYLLCFKRTRYQKSFRIAVVLVAVLSLSFLQSFMLFMQFLLQQLGLSTRIFDKYFDDTLEESYGRDFIRETLLDELNIDAGVFGHGILGSYNYVDTYAHNIVLDFLFSFGLIIGPILLLGLALLLFNSFRKMRGNEEEQVFLILLIVASVIKLFFSGTFIDDTLFFFLIGYSIQHCRIKTITHENLLRL